MSGEPALSPRKLNMGDWGTGLVVFITPKL